MTFLHQMDVHQSRCQEQLLRLRMLARTWDGAAVPQEVVAEIRDATNTIIAEAEAMTRAAIRDHRRQEPQAETFLWVRITRLAAAADRAVDAARSRDVPGLRAHLRQFDTLTSAIWAVQHAAYGKQPGHSPRRDGNLRHRGQHDPRLGVGERHRPPGCAAVSIWPGTSGSRPRRVTTG